MTTSRPTPRRGAPNPFYVLLLAASTLFVVTCFGYLVSPTVLEQARGEVGAEAKASFRLATWLDRNGPAVFGVEFVAMLVAGGLAVATDRWFPEKPQRGNRPAAPRPD